MGDNRSFLIVVISILLHGNDQCCFFAAYYAILNAIISETTTAGMPTFFAKDLKNIKLKKNIIQVSTFSFCNTGLMKQYLEKALVSPTLL